MLCQHCDNAPCESVCSVFAAYHNPEGLNVQVYARCVGTRYCSNNCPYKVRRFNWRQHVRPEPQELMLNPDMPAREAGVMEKCTFCIQRIRAAKDKAKDESRKLRDGEFTTACAQSCPTGAIVSATSSTRSRRSIGWHIPNGPTACSRPWGPNRRSTTCGEETRAGT
jgi:molybdopterin-containing oxidoreductase family iron-sulfur binding subunit